MNMDLILDATNAERAAKKVCQHYFLMGKNPVNEINYEKVSEEYSVPEEMLRQKVELYLKPSIDLWEYQFPKLTETDLAFSTLNTIPEILKEAQLRGFDSGRGIYYQMFNDKFFNGIRVTHKNVEDSKSDQRQSMVMYFLCLCKSFSPKHEHKEAVCSMLMSELYEPEYEVVKNP